MVRCLFSCCSHPHLAAVVILISFGFAFTGQQNSILQTHLCCKNLTEEAGVCTGRESSLQHLVIPNSNPGEQLLTKAELLNFFTELPTNC